MKEHCEAQDTADYQLFAIMRRVLPPLLSRELFSSLPEAAEAPEVCVCWMVSCNHRLGW